VNVPGNLSALRVRIERRQHPVNFRVTKVQWFDPYPWVPGTVPEKMVFADLMSRGIQFVFQAPGFPPGQENGPHFVKRLHDIRPDFLIPSIQVVIEVQGTYFHTQPEVEQHDLDKLTEYRAWGWKVYWLWDLDILVSAKAAVEMAPEVTGAAGTLGTYLPKAREGTFTAPGATTADADAVAAANRKRARPSLPILKTRVVRGRRRRRPKVAAAKPMSGAAPVKITLSVAERRALQKVLKAQRPAPPKKKKKGK
jgi:hypothetical protein